MSSVDPKRFFSSLEEPAATAEIPLRRAVLNGEAAAFFEGEASSELDHAKGLQDYMTGFNIIPVIPAAETTKQFTSLPQIIREAYGIELDLMKKYNMSSSKLFGSDLTTFDFLQGYREIQKESVVEYNDLINALSLINEDNKLDVLYFEQTYL